MTSSNKNEAKIRILSLAEARSLFALYETMVETARSHDWDRLVEIEHQAASLRDSAAAHPASSPEAQDMETKVEYVEELATLLARIQRLDNEVRSMVEPAHKQARQQLAVEVKDRTVRKAYSDPETPGG